VFVGGLETPGRVEDSSFSSAALHLSRTCLPSLSGRYCLSYVAKLWKGLIIDNNKLNSIIMIIMLLEWNFLNVA
jgi:hypothetical protein